MVLRISLALFGSLALCYASGTASAFLLPTQSARGNVVTWSVPTKEGAAPAAQSSNPNTPPNPTTVAVPTGPKRMTITETLKFSPNRWRVNGKELEPGVGGIWPGKPDAKTYSVTIRDVKKGVNYTMDVPEDRYIYFAFEDAGFDLPLINKHRMCRNGCCTTCALKIREGKTKMEAALGLLRTMRQQNYALSCCALPRSDIVADLQDEDEVYVKQWGESFESGGVVWGGFLPDDD